MQAALWVTGRRLAWRTKCKRPWTLNICPFGGHTANLSHSRTLQRCPRLALLWKAAAVKPSASAGTPWDGGAPGAGLLLLLPRDEDALAPRWSEIAWAQEKSCASAFRPHTDITSPCFSRWGRRCTTSDVVHSMMPAGATPSAKLRSARHQLTMQRLGHLEHHLPAVRHALQGGKAVVQRRAGN